MNHKIKRISVLTLALLLLAVGAVALAQTGGGYDLTWSSVDGGGGASSAGGYTLSGTAGQADAGVLSGGGYTLGGGFWKGGAVVGSLHQVYLPCVLRNTP
jgi:hypothetical protein